MGNRKEQKAHVTECLELKFVSSLATELTAISTCLSEGTAL